MKHTVLLLPALLASLFVSCESMNDTASTPAPDMMEVVVMRNGRSEVIEVPAEALPSGGDVLEGRKCTACGGSGVQNNGIHCGTCYGLGSVYR